MLRSRALLPYPAAQRSPVSDGRPGFAASPSALRRPIAGGLSVTATVTVTVYLSQYMGLSPVLGKFQHTVSRRQRVSSPLRCTLLLPKSSPVFVGIPSDRGSSPAGSRCGLRTPCGRWPFALCRSYGFGGITVPPSSVHLRAPGHGWRVRTSIVIGQAPFPCSGKLRQPEHSSLCIGLSPIRLNCGTFSSLAEVCDCGAEQKHSSLPDPRGRMTAPYRASHYPTGLTSFRQILRLPAGAFSAGCILPGPLSAVRFPFGTFSITRGRHIVNSLF